LGEVKILFLNGPSLACQTRIADATTLPVGGSEVPTNAHSVQVVLVGISGRPCDNSRMVGYPEVIHFHPFGHAGGADVGVVPPPSAVPARIDA